MKTFSFVINISKKFPLLLVANVALLALVGLIEAVSIFTLVPVIDLFTKPDLQGASFITQKAVAFMGNLGVPATLQSFVLIFLAFNILIVGIQILIRHLILRTKYAVLRDLMVGTFEDLFNARWYLFTSTRQGVLLNTFTNEVRVVGDAFGAIALFFTSIVQAALYLVVPFYLSWQVAGISLFTAILFACPFALFGRLNYKLGKGNVSTANEMWSVVQESFSLAKVILGFGQQRKSVATLTSAFNAHCRATIKSQTLSIAVPLMYYPLGISVMVIALFSARHFMVPLAETAALLYSLLKVIPFIGQVPAIKNNLDNFYPSYEQLLNLKESARQQRQKTGDKVFTDFYKEISIKDLSFAYPGHDPVLADISVTIPKGKMVAFVGESGSGKSTLIDMIIGFHEPAKGQIRLDDVPLPDFDIKTYRSRIGYVPQDTVLFNTTIRNNLRWANESATDSDIRQACQQANALEFIERFPKNYDTVVGDRGVRLSGGQSQRIALARAILRKPAILILDEATSSLDTHSERLIQEAIEKIAKETTVIIIAHRISTVVNADYIYVLKRGRLVEQGRYSELMGRNGEFNRMVNLQDLETARQKDLI